MKITFYSTGCAKCNVLAQKLDAKGVEYDICSDIEVMQSKGIMSAPCLGIDDKILTYKAAIDWVNALEG